MSDTSAVDPRHEAIKALNELGTGGPGGSLDRNDRKALVFAVLYLADVLKARDG
jgi:hypothetical protein